MWKNRPLTQQWQLVQCAIIILSNLRLKQCHTSRRPGHKQNEKTVCQDYIEFLKAWSEWMKTSANKSTALNVLMGCLKFYSFDRVTWKFMQQSYQLQLLQNNKERIWLSSSNSMWRTQCRSKYWVMTKTKSTCNL